MELRDYLRGLRRHWVAIALLTALGVGVGYGWTLIQTPVYEASASGFVASRQTQDVGMSTVGDSLARSKVQSYLDIAGWRNVAEHAISELGLDTTPEALVKQVTVTNTPDTVILKIAARGPTPIEARDLAEAWIRGMVVAIDGIEGTGSPGSSPVTIIPGDSASLPSSPLFPDVTTALIVGGVLGLGFGIAFALIRTVSDRRIRVTDDVEGRTGVAVVGSIPIVEHLVQGQRVLAVGRDDDGDFAVREAFRVLRTNLQFMDVDNPPRKIVITSPLPGDGKSSMACNIAVTLAASGRSVVLVDGDLRRSTVAASMGLPAGAGLTDVLAGRAELTDVLQRAPQSANLLVLAAGSVPPNPSEVLGSARMSRLLADLAKFAIVIIDAPPILPVTDAAVLTHQADGALLVVNVGKTTYDLVDKSLDLLHKARGRTLGLVLNRIPLRGVNSSPYSYAYARSYSAPRETVDVSLVPEDVLASAPRTATAEPAENASSDPFEALVKDGAIASEEAASPRPRARRVR